MIMMSNKMFYNDVGDDEKVLLSERSYKFCCMTTKYVGIAYKFCISIDHLMFYVQNKLVRKKAFLFWAVFIELFCWNRKRISHWSISNFFVASGKIVWQLLEPSQMLKVLRDASRRRKEERGGESAQISCLSGAITNSRNFSNPTFSLI